MGNQSQPGLEDQLEKHDVHLDDKNVVSWNEKSTRHPQNWSHSPKYYTAAIVIWLEFYMTMLSSSGAATAKATEIEWGISKVVGTTIFVTVYLLGQTVGGIFCSPISEVFGRRTIYLIATVSFGISSVIVAAPSHIAGIVVGRFFQGVSAAIPATVAFGNFADLFNVETRVWVVYIYTLLGMAGLSLGPIYSSYVTSSLSWQWVHYMAAIASAVSAAACLVIKESNADQLLEDTTKDLQHQTGAEDLKPDTERPNPESPIQHFLQNNVYRPVSFLFTEPLVKLCAVLCAVAFGLIYGLTESLTIVYTTPPFSATFNEVSSSLAFLAILLGELLGVLPRIYDSIILEERRILHKPVKPEDKLGSFAIACPSLAIGLWIFAWTVPPGTPNVPWPVSLIGLVCIGFAANDFSYVLFGYITDSYGTNAASAVSVLSTARTLTAALVPLFITQFYEKLGNNIASTLIAVLATLFCVTPVVFLRYGERLRERSHWAVSGKTMQ